MCGALQRFTKTAASTDSPPPTPRRPSLMLRTNVANFFLLWDFRISLLLHKVLRH